MSRQNWSWSRILVRCFAIVAFSSIAIGCSDGSAGDRVGDKSVPVEPPEPQIVEVSPPTALQELHRDLDLYRPQVSIVTPEPDTVFEEETVTVQLQVKDLPTFKDNRFGLGPHLNVILDNQPEISVYDSSQPLVLEDLSPGTHTLRVFASRPWHESFKNDGAYAQTTFHIYARTDENQPDPRLPLLTYSRPKGSYGAEPIMLDYYLTNAPLHLVAQESPEDEIVDWQIRWTIDGKSFTNDRWQPIYIQGFLPGKHWVQLEFLDELGNPVKNTFNNTVRTIVYEPGGEDTLSKLVRGELNAADVRAIIDPNYVYEEESSLEEKSAEELVPEESEAEVLDEETVEVEILPAVPDEEIVEEQPEVLDEEALEGETSVEVLDEPTAEVLDEETVEVEVLPAVSDEELLEEQPVVLEEPDIFDKEALEGETSIEVLDEPTAEVLDEETVEVETLPEVLDEELVEEQPDVLDEGEALSEEIEEPAAAVLDEEAVEVEALTKAVEEPEAEILDEEEVVEVETLSEEEQTVVSDIEDIEPIGEEQIENIETIEIQLPDLGLYPTVPRGLDMPEFSELEGETEVTQTSLETSAAQLDRDILEEMPAEEGNRETLETPMEEIELL